jgi:hypothetical protein
MQVDEKRACPSCGGDNPASAAFCWRCYTPLGRAAAAPPRAGLAATRAPAPAFPPPPIATAPVTEPAASGSSGISWGVRIVVGVLASLVGYFGVQLLFDHGPSLPDTLAGAPRMTSQAAKDFEKQMADQGKQHGLHVAAAAYGAGTTPDFMVLLIEGSSLQSTDQMFDQFVQGMSSSGASVDSANADSGQRGSTEYRCVPVSTTSVTAAACMWRDEKNVGVVLKLNAGVPETLDLLFTAHDAVA